MTVSQVGSDFYALLPNGATINNCTLVEDGVSRSQDGRSVWVKQYQGTQAGIDALAVAFSTFGCDTSSRLAPGGKSVLTVVFSYQPGTTEVPEEDWFYEERASQPSIYTHPSIAPIITPEYKKTIEDALKENGPNPFAGTTPASAGDDAIGYVLFNLYERLIRGTDAWEQNKPFIRRTRSFSTAFAPRNTFTLTRTCYSRASLISEFDVPSAFQPQIPLDPTWAAPVGTRWGWAKGEQSGGYNRATRRYQESSIWEGAFCDLALYTFE